MVCLSLPNNHYRNLKLIIGHMMKTALNGVMFTMDEIILALELVLKVFRAQNAMHASMIACQSPLDEC